MVQQVGPRAPNLNACAERWAQSLRQECLDHFVILGEGHLRHLLKEYLETWDEFVKRHAETLWACDFLSVRSATLAGFVDLYLLFFIHVGSRRVFLAGTTANPTRAWVAQQARNMAMVFQDASRALNPATRDQVSRATSRRVARAAERLGYVPNTLARGLRTARSYLTAMVVPDITNPLFPPMVRGAEQVLSGAGYTLVLTDTGNDAATERRQIEQLRARGTDGFIVAKEVRTR